MTSLVGVTLADFNLPATATSRIDADHAARLAATLDCDAPSDGCDLPPLWHWGYFTPSARTSALGDDGHPRLPADSPATAMPRRMWAGGRLRHSAPFVVGDPATRRSAIVEARRTTGRSGAMLVLTIEHRYAQRSREVLVEEQDVVYRAPGERIPLPGGNHREPAPDGGWSRQLQLGPAALFRFSAVTFNSHRIHYDVDYTTGTEGYPAPVVPGPLTALLLAQEICAATGRPIATFEFRATAPLFAGQEFTLVGSAAASEASAKAYRNDGRCAMSASAQLA